MRGPGQQFNARLEETELTEIKTYCARTRKSYASLVRDYVLPAIRGEKPALPSQETSGAPPWMQQGLGHNEAAVSAQQASQQQHLYDLGRSYGQQGLQDLSFLRVPEEQREVVELPLVVEHPAQTVVVQLEETPIVATSEVSVVANVTGADDKDQGDELEDDEFRDVLEALGIGPLS